MILKVLVYCPQNKPRINYSIRVVFQYVLNWNIEFTDSLERIKAHDGVKLAYSYQPIDDVDTIIATGLLHEKDIDQFELQVDKT